MYERLNLTPIKKTQAPKNNVIKRKTYRIQTYSDPSRLVFTSSIFIYTTTAANGIQTAKRVLVVAGLGNGSGTGAATARLFAKQGYSVALVARGAASVDKLAAEINSAGGQVSVPFAVPSYSHDDITAAWGAIHAAFPAPAYAVRAAVFNVSHGVWKPFLDVTPQDVQECLQTSVAAAFAFARGAVLAFKGTGSTRRAGSAARCLGQGAVAESGEGVGKENIHVAHAIIDGGIFTDRSPPELKENYDVRLSPESIAASYLYLVNQDRSAWTWELDLRPAHEKCPV
ncbi:hypothetical protein BJ912DRAFT_1039899 [Pholiota molesta]|nr:hypothetical protein BJ912DRAFT_1039899 [Pholiota molesta]